MTELEILNKIAVLSAKHLALRDVVARLIAREAKTSGDVTEVLEDISDMATAHIHDTEKRIGQDATEGTMTISAIIQAEVD
jgi:aspartate oxidase